MVVLQPESVHISNNLQVLHEPFQNINFSVNQTQDISFGDI